MTKEIWKKIKMAHWGEKYEVSNLGRVRIFPRVLKMKTVAGYNVVKLDHRGVRQDIGVHRLVASAFIRPPKIEEEVNHIDADRANNTPSNLEWVTPAENVAHTKKLGRFPKGAKHRGNKIDVLEAARLRKAGMSYKDIGKMFGASAPAVCAYLKRARKDGRIE